MRVDRLSIWSNGVLLEYIEGDRKSETAFFPIQTLHYCVAVRYVNITGYSVEGSGFFLKQKIILLLSDLVQYSFIEERLVYQKGLCVIFILTCTNSNLALYIFSGLLYNLCLEIYSSMLRAIFTRWWRAIPSTGLSVLKYSGLPSPAHLCSHHAEDTWRQGKYPIFQQKFFS